MHSASSEATFLNDCAEVIKQRYFGLDPNANFSLIVLAAAANE